MMTLYCYVLLVLTIKRIDSNTCAKWINTVRVYFAYSSLFFASRSLWTVRLCLSLCCPSYFLININIFVKAFVLHCFHMRCNTLCTQFLFVCRRMSCVFNSFFLSLFLSGFSFVLCAHPSLVHIAYSFVWCAKYSYDFNVVKRKIDSMLEIFFFFHSLSFHVIWNPVG